jgi:hypothetical protein
MRRIGKEIVALVILFLLLTPSLTFADNPKDSPEPSQPFSIWQVRRAMVAAFANSYSYS